MKGLVCTPVLHLTSYLAELCHNSFIMFFLKRKYRVLKKYYRLLRIPKIHDQPGPQPISYFISYLNNMFLSHLLQVEVKASFIKGDLKIIGKFYEYNILNKKKVVDNEGMEDNSLNM